MIWTEKMSSRNWSDSGGGRGHNGEIIRQGYLKKLKTKRKKYFVLRGECGENSAQLEYYDSEKKLRTHHPPKRAIVLKTCFNINRRTDLKNKFVIALYTRRDCFCIDFDNEPEMDNWLKTLLELQLGEDLPDGTPIKPTFEHVWPVTVLNKELGGKTGILGPHHLCLTDSTLTLVKVSSNDHLDSVEFSLQKIRRCGHVDSFFYMEVGQCTVTGAGNLWMQTEDTNIAENMHSTILRNCSKKDQTLPPKTRDRSQSANEVSKTSYLMQRCPTSTSGGTGINHQRTYSFPLSPLPPTRRASTGTRPHKICTSSVLPQPSLTVRERSDSLPSRARTTSEGAPHLPLSSGRSHLVPSTRPHSMYNKGINYSPPVGSSPVSPGSGACSDSAGSSLSMDGDCTDTTWESESIVNPILEEEGYGPWSGEDEKMNNNIQPDHCLEFRKHSPNPIFKSCSPSQSPYMDMNSPCGSSPMEVGGNYLAMSPGESRPSFYSRAGSGNHSRGSSVTEDGYVPMAPGSNEDYVEMDPKPRKTGHFIDRYMSGDASTGSSCSITSGTPSGDLRLDKVSTYFSPDEEMGPTERQTRAYSVGSRPVNNNARPDNFASSTGERVRAFSVGSKNGKIHPRISPLWNHLSSSHSSVEPSDDMMEMDFSKERNKNRRKPNSSERLSVPGGGTSTASSAASSYSTAEGSYFESPRGSPSLASPPKSSRLSALIGKSPPKQSLEFYFSKASPPLSGYSSPLLGRVPETEPGYLEMTSTGKGDLTAVKMMSKSPPEEPYVEMKPWETIQVRPKTTKARLESFPGAEPTIRPQHLCKSSPSPPIKQPLVSTKTNKGDHIDLKRKTSLLEDNNNSKLLIPSPFETENEGYVEMTITSKPKTLSESSSKSDGEPNYMNMSVRIERRGSRKDARNSSEPITIPEIYSRKFSAGTPPKVPSTFLKTPSLRSRAVEKLLSGLGSLTINTPATDATTKSGLQIDSILKHCTEELNESDGNPKGDRKPLSRSASTCSTGDKELHYASLDLNSSDATVSSETPTKTSCTKVPQESPTSSASVTPDASMTAFEYAEIDFAKSGAAAPNYLH